MNPKILHYFPYEISFGGAGRSTIRFARFLEEEGYKQVFLIWNRGSRFDQELEKAIPDPERIYLSPPAIMNLFNRKIAGEGIWGFIKYVIAFLVYNIRLASLIRKNGITHLFMHTSRAPIAVGLSARLAGIKGTTIMHGHVETGLFQEKFLKMAVGLFTDTLLTVDKRTPLKFPLLRRKRMFLIANYSEDFPAQRPPKQLTEKKSLQAGTLAAITRDKGIDLLPSVASQLRSSGIECVFHIGGAIHNEDYYRDVLESAKRLGVEDMLIFYGLVPKEVILDKVDVFVLPSRYEGQPISIIEAMSWGIPVVATDVAGVPDMIRNGIEGFVVPPGNSMAIAEAIKNIAVDPDLYTTMARNARERFEKMYTKEKAYEQYRRIFKEVFSSEAPPANRD
jgi:glycosyltransferase involved in cell wall biosynthesis